MSRYTNTAAMMARKNIRHIGIYVDINDILDDCADDMPMAPVTSDYEIEVEVQIHGSYTPAVLYPNDKAQPAEYPEAECQSDADDLAAGCLTFYRSQLHAAGISLTQEQAADFLRIATSRMSREIETAEQEALENDE